MNLSEKDLLELVQKITPFIIKAGKIIKDSWYSIKSFNFKDKRDLATDVDIQVENYLKENLSVLLPEAGFYVEESKSELRINYNWSIDPIDGTKYYAGLFPIFVTQIALLKGSEPLLGLIYNPVSNQLFTASKNNGTYFNYHKVIPHAKTHPEEAIVEYDFGGNDDEIDSKIKIFNKLVKCFYRVRIFGGTIVSYMITGAIDAYILVNKKNKLVDRAPNKIILQEAGFVSRNISIPQYKDILVITNQKLFESIEILLK